MKRRFWLEDRLIFTLTGKCGDPPTEYTHSRKYYCEWLLRPGYQKELTNREIADLKAMHLRLLLEER